MCIHTHTQKTYISLFLNILYMNVKLVRQSNNEIKNLIRSVKFYKS